MEKVQIIVNGKSYLVENNSNLLTALHNNGISVPAYCGGAKKCLKCKVVIKNANTHAECEKLLSHEEYEAGVRLACFCNVENGLIIDTIQENTADVLSIDKDLFHGKIALKDTVGVKKYAIVDIGTTTITITILDEKYRLLDTINYLNPEKVYGADVISRIQKCDEGHLDTMSKLISSSIYKELTKYDVEKVIISANNVMLHILTNTSPHSIGVSPYLPKFKELKEMTFNELFGEGEGTAILLPSISGYVGADIVSGIIATDLELKDNVLLIDLGTNGEMVLSTNGKLFATSTAAGPAFEGGNISCGSYARKGAISKVEPNGDTFKVDDINADSICGSGLIDAIATMLNMDIIDEMGGFDDCNDIVKDEDDEYRVYLTDKVYISQKDVRNVQLAKGAISCGITCLLKHAGITADNLDKILIAGGFSKTLDFESCERLGLIPLGTAVKCVSSGNTSILGAFKCLQDEKNLERATNISNSATVLELGQEPDFFNIYAESMMF